jgi:L-ribulose-5-phosphate 3-epimerase
MTRRDLLKRAIAASAALPPLARAYAQTPTPNSQGPAPKAQAPTANTQPATSKSPVNPVRVRVGMTDWNLGQRGDITKIALAREIGLDGIQVSVQYPTDGKTPTLRDPATQAAFKRAALDNGIQICSLAIGNPGKSRLPMHTNPAFAILLVEAVEIAHNLGTNNILLPILGDSHIDMTSQAQVDSFVAMMKEVARYAEKYGVVVALEDWISAEDNIKIVDAIASDYVGVYYDCHNIVPRVKDIYVEPKMLGKRIHQIHVKNANMLLSEPGGRVDWPRMAQEFYDIGYRGWYVLETNSPTRDIIADTRANIEYVKKTFRMPPAHPA